MFGPLPTLLHAPALLAGAGLATEGATRVRIVTDPVEVVVVLDSAVEGLYSSKKQQFLEMGNLEVD